MSSHMRGRGGHCFRRACFAYAYKPEGEDDFDVIFVHELSHARPWWPLLHKSLLPVCIAACVCIHKLTAGVTVMMTFTRVSGMSLPSLRLWRPLVPLTSMLLSCISASASMLAVDCDSVIPTLFIHKPWKSEARLPHDLSRKNWTAYFAWRSHFWLRGCMEIEF